MPIAYPYKFSDWYGYDKDCVALTAFSSSSMGVFNQACSNSGFNPCCTQTYYHNGSGATPVAGDNCFSDSAGTTVLLGGYYNINSAIGVGNRLYIRISSNSTGEVDSGYPQTC